MVIGYGVQKKSVVTASIAKVGADELAQTAPTRVDNALKGLAAGVQVTTQNGQPGSSSVVRVRGIGTINNSDPLYIVDGMPIGGGIDNINPADIESIEVLKDAASAAVYGARAANGVVLVTTKKGKEGKVNVNYDFSFGWQSAWKHRDMLDASEYATLMNEAAEYNGTTPKYSNPASLGKGTDWQDVLFNDGAPVQNHQLSVSGASEKINYYFSMGYYNQEGIVGGNYDHSNYERLSFRSNTQYKLFDQSKQRNWLRSMTIGVNMSYSRINSRGINAGNLTGSALADALFMDPNMDVYESFYVAKLEANELRKGTGRKLIHLAKCESRRLNCEGRVHLDAVNQDNPPFYFYRRMGFDSQDKHKIEIIDKLLEKNKPFPEQYKKWCIPMYFPTSKTGTRI